MKFLGCTIRLKTKRNITLTMEDYAEKMKEISIQKCRQVDTYQRATDGETHDYRSMAGTLLYLNQAVLPYASFIASKMQQKLGALRVCDIIEANSILREMKHLNPKYLFKSPILLPMSMW